MTDRNDMQTEIAAIWSRLLGVKAIGPDDNFFALGGHSLLGVKLIAAVQAQLDLGDELKLADLFENPTLDTFSAHAASLAAPSEESGAI